jgi:hypothetical protein
MSRTYTKLAIVLVLLGLGAGAYWWWYGKVVASTNQAAAIAERIQETQSDAARARDAENQLGSILLDEAAVRGHFVASNDVVPFLGSLESVGTSLGADVEVVSVSDQKEPRPMLSLSLRITGPFAAVVRTVGALEYAPYDVEVRRMGMVIKSQGEGAAVWVAEVQLFVGTR